MISKRLELIFTNSQGRAVTIAVPEPREDLTPAEVEAVMQTIISENLFDSAGGDLVAIRAARIVTREVNEFQLIG